MTASDDFKERFLGETFLASKRAAAVREKDEILQRACKAYKEHKDNPLIEWECEIFGMITDEAGNSTLAEHSPTSEPEFYDYIISRSLGDEKEILFEVEDIPPDQMPQIRSIIEHLFPDIPISEI